MVSVFAIQDFYWRDYAHGFVPKDAFEGKPGIYIGQVYYNGHGLIPATVYPYRNAAVMVYDTRQNMKENIKVIKTNHHIITHYKKFCLTFQILCNSDTSKFYWQAVNFNQSDIGQMAYAIRGGFQDDQNLFIGLVKHEGSWKIGKVKDIDAYENKGLYVWDKAGNHVKFTNFHLLKYNFSNTPSSDPYAYDIRNLAIH